MSEMIQTLIKAIKALAVIIIVIALVLIFFRNILPIFKEEALSPETEQHYKDNFDVLISNIEKCRTLQDTKCLCNSLPSFPASFATGSKLLIEEISRNTYINLTYKNKAYKSAIIKDLKLSIFLLPEKKYYQPKKTLDFSKEPPEIAQDGLSKFLRKKPRIISGQLYKNEDALYFLAFYEYKKTEELNEMLDSFKKCGEE